MEYKPPFSINDDIINLLAKTSELVGQVSILHKSSSLKLRRENRIKTIPFHLLLRFRQAFINAKNGKNG